MYIKYGKRLLDLLFCIIGLPIFAILFIIVAPVIYLTDKGPIFYCAPRLGKNGVPFHMFKFRSMKTKAPDIRNEDGSTFNASDDPRLTAIGGFLRRTSIDEIPQLLNVLKGDMSIIGPRPDLPDQISLYENEEIKKLDVKPGLTGYNQAYFRNSIPVKQRFSNDIYYVEHISLLLDLRILLKTVSTVLTRSKVYNNKVKVDENCSNRK